MAVLGSFDAAQVRRDFPILGTLVHGRPLVYFSSISEKAIRIAGTSAASNGISAGISNFAPR